MSKDELKNDKAWRLVFENSTLLTEIKEAGFGIISTRELKALGGNREPRLMAKIDYTRVKPKVFKEHSLNILPISKLNYVVFKDPANKCFCKVGEQTVLDNVRLFKSQNKTADFDTLRKGVCTSESDVIEIANLSGLLDTFCKTKNLRRTRSGKFSSGSFEIRLPSSPVTLEVKGTQIEVDGIFESEDVIAIVEAKMGHSDDFNVRQLLYPYKVIRPTTSKPLITLLLSYSNGIYRLTEFTIDGSFDNTQLERQEFFTIDELPDRALDLEKLLSHLPASTEPLEFPFPQADKLDKVIDTVRAVERGMRSKDDLALHFGFNVRQSDYYKNAARYLGWLEGNDVTKIGEKLLKEPTSKKRSELILKCMLTRSVFRESFRFLTKNELDLSALSESKVETLLTQYRPDLRKKSTRLRRAKTLRTWFSSILTGCTNN